MGRQIRTGQNGTVTGVGRRADKAKEEVGSVEACCTPTPWD